MSLASILLLILVLAVHVYFRVQAQRRSVDEAGRRAAFRWWRLRLLPPERYPSPEGRRYWSLTVLSALAFMVLAAVLMLGSYAVG